MSNFHIRPVTVLLILASIVLVAISLLYFTKTATDLPAFFPGHAAHSTKHHVKHGIALVILALLALGAAWFSTNPDHSRSN
jgi:hypothetical protein